MKRVEIHTCTATARGMPGGVRHHCCWPTSREQPGANTESSGAAVTSAIITIVNEGHQQRDQPPRVRGRIHGAQLAPGPTRQAELDGFNPTWTKRAPVANRTVLVDMCWRPVAVTQTVEVTAKCRGPSTAETATIVIFWRPPPNPTAAQRRTLDRLSASRGRHHRYRLQPPCGRHAYWGGISSAWMHHLQRLGNGGGTYSPQWPSHPAPVVPLPNSRWSSTARRRSTRDVFSNHRYRNSVGNDFHGSCSVQPQPRIRRALYAFTAQPVDHASYNRNEFGYTIGGPIDKNKTFFLHSYRAAGAHLAHQYPQ